MFNKKRALMPLFLGEISEKPLLVENLCDCGKLLAFRIKNLTQNGGTAISF